jgi:integrase/recombinase XerD
LTQNPQKKVAEIKQRNYAVRIAKFWLGEKHVMPKQAKTLTQQNLRQVLDYVAQHKHALRNRTMLLVTHWAGMRVGEVAALRICDVLGADGAVMDEIALSASQTKGNDSRTVLVPKKLQEEK